MNLEVKFANEAQRQFYYSTARNECFSGGFNNGKTYIGCFKMLTLLLSFPNYRGLIARQVYSDLKKTTMQTFFKQCPPGIVDSHNEQDGITRFKNSSTVYWMHLDNVDVSTLRGLEINSCLIDQAEETEEKVYDVLDARIGRWDGAIVPSELLNSVSDWPRSRMGSMPLVPSYLMLLTNPDTQFHYIYRKYHPESMEHDPDYFFVEGEWDPNLGSEETYAAAIKRDTDWVNKYVKGKWGTSSAAIHFITKESLLKPTNELITRIKEKGNLFRTMDHGESSPTCCLWVAAIDGVYIFYREYYAAGKLISYHRQSIHDLSMDEKYSSNYADPAIFKKTQQKDGGFWAVADEYKTRDVEAPPLYWIPADNNEFATRNRINELLTPSARFRHPITRETPAPGIYFIEDTPEYPYGCKEAIRQTGAQRRKFIGTIDGKNIYADDRDETITDHAYDPVRYFVAMHGSQPRRSQKKPNRNSFAYYNAIINRTVVPKPGSIQ